MKKTVSLTEPLKRRYSPEDLRLMFIFCKSDFDMFLDLLIWLDSLTKKQAKEFRAL